MEIAIAHALFFAERGIDWFLMKESERERFHVAFSNLQRDWIDDDECRKIAYRLYKPRAKYLPKSSHITFEVIKSST